MTASRILTPRTTQNVADLKAIVNRIEKDARDDAREHAQRVLADYVAANGPVVAAAKGATPGSPARQAAVNNLSKIKTAQEAIANPSTSSEELNQLIALLTVLTEAIKAADHIGQSQPLDTDTIAAKVADKLAPRLAPPTPTPAPKPEPVVDLERLVDAAADKAADRAVERFIPFLATDDNNEPTKAASKASVDVLTERMGATEAKADAAATKADHDALAGRVDTLASSVTALQTTNTAYGLCIDEQGRPAPAPGTWAAMWIAMFNRTNGTDAANRDATIAALITLVVICGLTIVIFGPMIGWIASIFVGAVAGGVLAALAYGITRMVMDR